MADLLVCLFLLSVAARVSGYGTVITVFNAAGNSTSKKFPSGPSVANASVIFNPVQSSAGAPPGCFNLPVAIQGKIQSFQILWNTSLGTDQCKYVWFFSDLSCGNAKGNFGIKRGTSATATDYQITSTDPMQPVQSGVSLACSYTPDPCTAYPCKDLTATCTSILPNTTPWKDPSTGILWSNQTRICTCPVGSVLVNSLCSRSPSSPPPRTSSSTWLPPLNAFRASQSAKPLQWNASLAAQAQAQTDYLKAQLCATFQASGPSSAAMQGLKIKTSSLSEDDTWIQSFPLPAEVDAVNVWTAVPAKAPAARISSPNTVAAGCGKTLCGSDSYFFTCLFSPFTY